jgi:hypothetical protein
MKPNIIVRPNVYVRSSPDLTKDRTFLLQVRGRKALVKLLRRVSPSSDLQAAARAYLSQRQVAELAWDVPCADCGEFPEGAVRSNGHEEIQFRCPKQRCPSQHIVGRRVLLDPELVEPLIRTLGESLTELAGLALAGYQKSTTLEPTSHKPRRPYTIGVTMSQNYFFSDVDIEDALRQLAGEKQ